MGEKKGFFKRLVEGLTKTRNNIVSGIDSIFSGFSAIDEDFYEEIEEILIMGDLGDQCDNSDHRRSETEGERAAHQRAFCLQTTADRQHQKPR